jgi:hypothetical protein
VVSGVGAFIAVTTLFLFATTAYMAWRVYKMKKYRVKSDNKQASGVGQKDENSVVDKEKEWIDEEAKSGKQG